MSDLTQFRNHARRMSLIDAHTDDCTTEVPVRWSAHTRTVHPDPACPGCVPDNDRRLFARLANEIDLYLTGDDTPGLFETWPQPDATSEETT